MFCSELTIKSLTLYTRTKVLKYNFNNFSPCEGKTLCNKHAECQDLKDLETPLEFDKEDLTELDFTKPDKTELSSVSSGIMDLGYKCICAKGLEGFYNIYF